MKATEESGYITDDAGHTGIESLWWLIPAKSEATVTHGVLILTGALLLAFMLAASWLRFRLKLGVGGAQDEARMKRDIGFTAIFASVLTLTYQAFASYTIPDYLMGALIFVPVLVQMKFWTAWDQILIALTSYFQAVIYLVWFHFAEFGNPAPRTSMVFDVVLVLGNVCTVALWVRCAFRALGHYRMVLKKS